LKVCPDVAFYLLNKKRVQLAELETHAKKRIMVKQDSTLGLDEMKLELFDVRDGLVFLDELGSAAGVAWLTLRSSHAAGRRDVRAAGVARRAV